MESRKKDRGLEYAPVHSKTTTGSAPSDALSESIAALSFANPLFVWGIIETAEAAEPPEWNDCMCEEPLETSRATHGFLFSPCIMGASFPGRAATGIPPAVPIVLADLIARDNPGSQGAPIGSKQIRSAAVGAKALSRTGFEAHDNEDAFGFGGPGPIAPLFLDPRAKASLELLGCGPDNCSAA